jgi:hypothetical protein
MKPNRQLFFHGRASAVLAVVAVFVLTAATALAAEAQFMKKDDLKAVLEKPEIVVLDVRAGRDWSSSEFKIKGAERAAPGQYAQWAEKYPKDATIVLYCA